MIEGGIANAESFEVPLNYEFPLMEGGIANVESPGVPLNHDFPTLIEGGIANSKSECR